MTQAKQRFSNFEEYLEWSDHQSDTFQSELINGELIELPPEAEPNTAIATFLLVQFMNAGIPLRLLKPYQCEIQVRVLQIGDAQNRYPDLTVLREEHLPLTRKRLTIKLDMPPPQLAVEIVSPSSEERHYERKRDQYADIGIPEYWIVDSIAQAVTVLEWADGSYQIVGRFNGSERIVSPTLSNLQLTPEQIFQAAL
ncbi:Uma2 family endonuclease [Pseudanabaenaceae cyanobacterium LEGE 13415]|nr:Uma2 family endonuclease [Pseudanabaenaceae cyanobacterium LEGE 13415]